jgi:hypothetical protein
MPFNLGDLAHNIVLDPHNGMLVIETDDFHIGDYVILWPVSNDGSGEYGEPSKAKVEIHTDSFGRPMTAAVFERLPPGRYLVRSIAYYDYKLPVLVKVSEMRSYYCG